MTDPTASAVSAAAHADTPTSQTSATDRPAPGCDTASSAAPATPFHDLDAFTALPRVSGLALSPDGTRLVTTVATPNAAGTGFATALWEVDPTGQAPAHRLTRSAAGEAGAVFTHDGDLLFTSARPDPDAKGDDSSDDAALWRLPARGGEAELVLSRPGGVSAVTCARAADRVVVTADRLLGAADETEHARRAKARKDAGVDAILHTGYPVRFWDHDLGPARPELFALEPGPDPAAGAPSAGAAASEGRGAAASEGPGVAPSSGSTAGPARDAAHHLRPLTGFPRSHGFGLDASLAPDGSFLLTTVATAEARANLREGTVVRLDLDASDLDTSDADTPAPDASDGAPARTVLLDEPGVDVAVGPISHDGTRAVVVRTPDSTPQDAVRPRLHLMDTRTGRLEPLAHDWDRWAEPVGWLPDDSAVIALADDDGRRRVFRVDVPSGEVTCVRDADEAWSELVLGPDGRTAYGVRSSFLFPPELARLDLATGEAVRLPGPAERPTIPGRVEDVETAASDGTRVRGWLMLPEGEAPAGGHPLLLFIHGGPLGSFNAWTWRWCPWVFAAQGYAVLMPDPALSTGYGQDFVQRGWGRWGSEPYTDLMAITDAVVARDDVDADRTAALGGSFGGYMANWVAGHTGRFRAIVTHASLWALDGFDASTDASFYWRREMSEQMRRENSPHRHVASIVTPMLVIHGDKDYRVPIHEGLRLWYDLLSSSGLPAAEDGSTEHRFLYFPHENHWILSPQHARVWYAVVRDFLAEKVLGRPAPAPPEELGL